MPDNSDIINQRFDIRDVMTRSAINEMIAEEDANIFAALDTAMMHRDARWYIESTPSIQQSSFFELYQSGVLSASSLLDVMDIDYEAEVERMRLEQLSVPTVIEPYRPVNMEDLGFGPRFVEDSFVTTPAAVGAFPIRQDITVLPADDPAQLRVGWVIYEEIGTAIVNDYALSRVDFGETAPPEVVEEEVIILTDRQRILTRHTQKWPFGRHLDMGEDTL